MTCIGDILRNIMDVPHDRIIRFARRPTVAAKIKGHTAKTTFGKLVRRFLVTFNIFPAPLQDQDMLVRVFGRLNTKAQIPSGVWKISVAKVMGRLQFLILRGDCLCDEGGHFVHHTREIGIKCATAHCTGGRVVKKIAFAIQDIRAGLAV